MHRSRLCPWMLAVCLVAAVALAGPALGQEEPEKSFLLNEKSFQHPDLTIEAVYNRVGELPPKAATKARSQLQTLGVLEASARVDLRSGRFETLLPTTPLIPGRGVGNDLTWKDVAGVAPESDAAIERVAVDAFRAFLDVYAQDLGISTAELGEHRAAVHGGGDLVQIWIPRTISGIPVRDSYISATIGQGNLTLLSTHQWGDVDSEVGARIDEEDALKAAEDFLAPLNVTREWAKTELLYVPMAVGRTASQIGFGQGYSYALVWTVNVEVEDDLGSWEVLVDARTGRILANQDRNHYAEAKGGVYPVTNDGIVPDGVEQPGWPMPWMTVSTSGGNVTTTTGGLFSATGSVTGSLTGPYVRMNDNCGSSSLTQTGGLDFGTSGGDDCVTPGFGGAGNTHSSRSGFYELNRIKEMARSHLPSNGWLQNQLTANMNINSTCNAFWNGVTVNFYRSGGGCSNTGEIAGVFDHEWGHGMDDFDVNGSIAGPSGEGIADVYTALRLNDSCIGRNFRSTVCTGFGDPCTTCTGVRDIDYLKRQSGNPHTYSWSNSNCGGSVHCVGSVYAEAIWSLWKRKLQAAPYNMDNNTAHEVVNRLTFIGAGNVGTWFSGGPPNGGCSGTSGYMNYLAADDTNGNLNDGTPHMGAIYSAFNDQQIACGSPTVQNSGCSGVPTTAPNVTATPGNEQVSLSWAPVSGATQYEVFRAEGIFGCDFGKVKVADSSSTSFTDTGLQNGRDYSYVVIPKPSSNSCFGPASSCDTVQPAGAPPTPDFSVSCSPSSHTVQQGQSAVSTCTVTALNGYSGSVSLSCAGNPGGISCGFSPGTVSPTGNSTLTMTVSGSQSTGTYNFNVSGTDGTLTRTDAMSVSVTPQGQSGPQTAAYDSSLGAPKCAIAGSSCDSTTLLDSRSSSLNPPEPNASNTIDGCSDGTAGSYHNDESIDRIVVSSLNGLDFVPGTTVQVDVTVYAWSTGSSDRLDLYYTGNAMSPSWTYIGTITPPTGGLQTLSAQYTLPSGSMQAVRANFRYNGSVSPCTSGSYNDHDDLVFAVGGGGGPGVCVVDDDFENGAPNWVNEPASTCSTGAYVTGNPTQVTNGGVVTQIGGSHSGTTSIFTATNSSAGVNDVDGGNCILGSPSWSVPNASTLRVWYWHGQRDQGGDPSGDFFRLEYSLNNGSTWSTMASNGDQTSNASWTQATASIPGGSTVKVRMQCSDGTASGDLVECGMDDLSICP